MNGKKRYKELRAATCHVIHHGRQYAYGVRVESTPSSHAALPLRACRWNFQEAYSRLERQVKELSAELVQANTRLKEETGQRRQAETEAWARVEEFRELIGMIRATNKWDGSSTKDDLEMVEMIAGYAAIAVQNTELSKAEKAQSHCLQALQAQLIQVEKMADLGRLAVTLAHEINNPLQAMQSHLELAMDFPLPLEERRQCLDVIRQEIGHLSEITQRVLTFARPTTAQTSPVSIAELVSHTLALTGKQLQRSHVQVTTDIPESLQVLAVPDQLVQVFLNLIINAIEAIQENGHIQIRAHAEGQLGVVTFANDGPIIPREDLPRIFEPYFTSKPDGTGLGLPVSLYLIQQHGGTLTGMNRADGKGVVFTIEIPLL